MKYENNLFTVYNEEIPSDTNDNQEQDYDDLVWEAIH